MFPQITIEQDQDLIKSYEKVKAASTILLVTSTLGNITDNAEKN